MLDEKISNKRSNVRKRRKRKGTILMISFFMVFIIILAVKFISKPEQNQNNVQLANPGGEQNESSSKEDPNENEEIENNKLDNSSYLLLENDPNADDATIVAENTKGLLNGNKSYPVRTDGKKVVYLTFDDGPSTTNTPEVLDILDRYNIKATFFVLGKSIEANEEAKDILKDIAKNGHAIANHTYGHDYSYLYPSRTMNVDNIVSDIEKNNNIIKEILGKDFSTRVIRFPGGYWSWNGREPMRDKMVEKGYCNVDWNALNEDAEGKTKNADELLQKTKERVEALGPNADSVVLLMHDTYGKEETVKALPQVIEYLQSKGYEFRTIK